VVELVARRVPNPVGDLEGKAGLTDPTNAVGVTPNERVGMGRVGDPTTVLVASPLLTDGEEERLGETDMVAVGKADDETV